MLIIPSIVPAIIGIALAALVCALALRAMPIPAGMTPQSPAAPHNPPAVEPQPQARALDRWGVVVELDSRFVPQIPATKDLN